MGRPRLIIVIRHAQSEGNKNRDIHQTIPDHRVKITPDGWQQAYEAGRRLRAMLRPDDTLHFFTSPYRRTRETTEGILATLTSDDPEPSPFRREKIKVYEEPRLREQDFGNFQPCSAEMERMWQERADYGHFFYRIPNGESAADAYDRISGFNDSLWRQFGEDDFASVCVLVTHGLMSRVFLMKWYHFSVEHFEDLRNINHCEFLIMRRNDMGKYILQNKLRTWSDLKRERALQLAKEKGGDDKDVATLSRVATVEVRRRWGGCPNGCNHDKSFKIRSTLADLVKSDSILSNSASGLAVTESSGSGNGSSGSTAVANGASGVNGTNDTNGGAVGSTHGITNPSFNGNANSQTLVSRRPAAKRFQAQATDETGETIPLAEAGPRIDVTKARDEVVSSPDGTPSFISVDDRLRSRLKSPNLPPRPLVPRQLHVGRDFGGTYSGYSDVASDDADSSSDDDASRRRVAAMAPSSSSAMASSVSTSNTSNSTASAAAGATASTAGTNVTTSQCPTPTPKHGLGLAPSAALPQHPHHQKHKHQRQQSRMGRGMRANRLGDHLSSDGEHEADCENEPESCSGCEMDDDDDDENGPEKTGKSTAVGNTTAAGTSGTSASAVTVTTITTTTAAVTQELADEADEALRLAEQEDRSVMGSVY